MISQNHELINIRKAFIEILVNLWKISKIYIVIIVFSIVASSMLLVLGPYIFSNIIDSYNGSEESLIVKNIFIGFLLYSILIGLSLIFKNTINYLSIVISQNVNYIAATSFFKNIIKKRSIFFIKHNPTEIQAIQNQGSQAVDILVQLMLMMIIPGIVQIVFSTALLGSKIDSIIVLTVSIYGLFFITFSYYSNKWTSKYLNNAVQEGQKNAQLVGNSIAMIEVLQLFNSTKWINNKFESRSKLILDNWKHFALNRVKYTLLFGLALTLQFIITFYILIPKLDNGEISIGDIVLFNTLLLQLNYPFEMIGISIERIIQSYNEFKPFSKMWNEDNKVSKENVVKNSNSSELDINNPDLNKLEFKNVSYKYGNGRGISNLSFSTQKGSITFLSGKSGSGKSTIFKLVLKQISPQSGNIFINNINLNTIKDEFWYSNIGVVPQEIMLLNDSIEANIVLGREYDYEKLVIAAKKASIFNKINELPEKFKTNIGERGLTLSGGERQRISIARALYESPLFLLLDEASSSLDEDTEADIMDNLRKISNETNIIAITHNLNLINSQDNVVKLN
ncbi:ABC transporter ATP-binding protein [Acinetobacter sp. 10FS3-1]|uniref:ATP-binding cassette domain-containing protein n=1 Tax=Acinetobacter sp. 10FS3-1 TaxID=2563897 RepID=UPI00157DC5E4|nr:ABC transporter ATP-binding protein [Acinetobacter sp. 10FS3-1]QKQ71661.1 ABC transporter ATP-binding protein [Acinetobacter sp. 10FS3-1]